MTQEQADALAAQGGAAGGFSARSGITLPEGFTPPAGAASSAASGSRATSQLPSTVTQNFQLKQGLTGTVELIVAQSSKVLLVPNTAITKAGTQRTVQVLKTDGTTEKRSVEVGLSDWQNTEITSGLSEGDKIIITKTATSSSPTTSTSQQRPQSIPFLGR
jgi:ABC-type uncharacterized transport system ATPase subunit